MKLSVRRMIYCAFFAMLVLLEGCSGGDDSSTTNITPVIEDVVEPPIVIEHLPATLDVEFQCDSEISAGLTTEMESAIVLAQSRYLDLLVKTTMSSSKYIDYTSDSGEWELQNATRWTSGFLPGVLWYLYGLSNDDLWREEALASTSGVAFLSTATDNDTSFQIYSSYGIGREILGGTWDEADVAIEEAATTLFVQRFNPNIGAFRAWPQSESDPFEITASRPFEVNVDMIMNMEALLSASALSGNNEHYDAAVAHADVTWDQLIRSDFSSYHVAGFNSSGSLSYNRTHQGWVEDSTWSRGQAWAVYGYVMMFRYTELPRMLERSEKAYQYFKLATQAQGLNTIPYADFDAPIDIRNPLDTSASAIVAAAAIELYEMTGNTLYLNDANIILNDLVQNYLSEGTDFESILLSGSEEYVAQDDAQIPRSSGYEVGASFGDFYFLEALYRLQNTVPPSCI